MGKQKVNIPMCAALVLLLLTLVSIHMTSGLYARYTATSAATDSARVAKFDVEGNLEPVDGEEGKFTLTVTNKSEVAVRYEITVEYDAPMSVTIGTETKTPETDSKIVTFTDDSWTLNPGEDDGEHILQFQITNWVGVTSSEKHIDTEPVEYTFDVSVTAVQID